MIKFTHLSQIQTGIFEEQSIIRHPQAQIY